MPTAYPPLRPPFTQNISIKNADDVRRLEQTPLAQAVPVQSTYEIFANSAAAFGERPALTFLRTANPNPGPNEQPITWRFADLLAGIHRFANALHRLGFEPTDTVAVLMPGSLPYHLALWGGSAAGIVQPLNPLLSIEKLCSLLKASSATVLVTWGAEEDSGYWTKAMALRDQVPTLRHVIHVAPVDGACVQPLPADVLDLDALMAVEPADHLVSGRRIGSDEVCAYFHTGGTTGSPKLACHTHGAQVFMAWSYVQLQGLLPGDVAINGFPLFHVAGVLPGSLAALSAGVHVVIPTTGLFRNREVIRNYWKLVEKYRATVLSGVSTVLTALTEVPLDGADISSLRYARTGAAPLTPELAARFTKLFGLHIYETYGMTEMVGTSTVTPPGLKREAGCVGLRQPYSQIRVVALDEQGGASDKLQPTGQSGMVQFKAPNVFAGYLNHEDNKHAFSSDGWLNTGDLGYIDEQECLHLSGRAKDLIIRGGHNIDPRVIEEALDCHPAVQTSAAVGAPDDYAGELPVAYVTLVPGAQVTEDALLEWVRERVDEPPARPRWVHVIPAMPLTNVGKIYKPELRELAKLTLLQSK
ncbi:MAG: acyl-CoA synthetase [Burkholderiaceae bacterium]|nr:acyl-CoA synthetase [Burkholderiaceae bacterium]